MALPKVEPQIVFVYPGQPFPPPYPGNMSLEVMGRFRLLGRLQSRCIQNNQVGGSHFLLEAITPWLFVRVLWRPPPRLQKGITDRWAGANKWLLLGQLGQRPLVTQSCGLMTWNKSRTKQLSSCQEHPVACSGNHSKNQEARGKITSPAWLICGVCLDTAFVFVVSLKGRRWALVISVSISRPEI